MTAPIPPPGSGGPDARPVDWSSVLARHERWLRTAVLARLGERQGADEVMQEVALAAVAQKARLLDASRVGAWLYRLAVVQVFLYRRRNGRRRRLWDAYATRRAATSEAQPDPLAWLVLDERRTLVREALSRLPPRDAEVLWLKYGEDWSYRELADHLGVSESAVEARLHRARQRLREALSRNGVIEGPQP
jgi:RNA polymerase sigma-70 factor (ECF subfamily)